MKVDYANLCARQGIIGCPFNGSCDWNPHGYGRGHGHGCGHPSLGRER